jgi:hypothetical protein
LDLELQIIHIPHVNSAQESAASGGAKEATHRRLAGDEAAAAESGEGGLYELQ